MFFKINIENKDQDRWVASKFMFLVASTNTCSEQIIYLDTNNMRLIYEFPSRSTHNDNFNILIIRTNIR